MAETVLPPPKLYNLISGFFRECDVDWLVVVEMEFDFSSDPSFDEFGDEELLSIQKIKQKIVDLIFVQYAGKQSIKVLFLDVDGVLNKVCNTEGEDDTILGDGGLDKELVLRLKTVIKETDCKIVLSSDWRLNERDKRELFGLLRKKGNLDIERDGIYIGDTPVIPNNWYRAFEIEAYLKSEHVKQIYNITKWCAVDDRNLIDPVGASKLAQQRCFSIMFNHFVRTKEEDGLTEKCMRYLIAKLNG